MDQSAESMEQLVTLRFHLDTGETRPMTMREEEVPSTVLSDVLALELSQASMPMVLAAFWRLVPHG